ncbi:hypothetical protein [Microcoleus sp. S13_C5]|uniref:hypothetical protein n=1 Tax=Microcoleus sp. S13_C5 TaxID=3055411 RepID=UPI002FD6A9A9
MSHHTFTYRHSELPAFRPEQKAEIVALGLHADDLILKSQGNYKELEELAETLSNCLDTCELNLQSIRIIPDDSPQPETFTLTDLPMSEQAMIFSTALFSAMVLSALQKVTKADINSLVLAISEQVNIEMADISDKQITAALASYLEQYRKYPTRQGFKVEIPTADI